jgi:predicted nucleic acid-binding protein
MVGVPTSIRIWRRSSEDFRAQSIHGYNKRVRVNRHPQFGFDILNALFEKVILPASVIAELGKANISVARLRHEVSKLSREELVSLTDIDPRLGKGESESFALARHRNLLLASNDKMVISLCKKEKVGYLTLPRILRLAVPRGAITRGEARRLLRQIEQEERTVIKDKDEVFR